MECHLAFFQCGRNIPEVRVAWCNRPIAPLPVCSQVRHEMLRQEEGEDEARGDPGPEREDHAVSRQHWGE